MLNTYIGYDIKYIGYNIENIGYDIDNTYIITIKYQNRDSKKEEDNLWSAHQLSKTHF